MNTVKHRLSQLSRLNHLTLASLLSLSAAAQAQTSWTATKLSAPLGARFYDYHPTLLTDQGGVQSGWIYKARNFLAINIYNTAPIVDYKYQLVSWGTGTSSSLSPNSGAKGFYPLAINAKGNAVGHFTTDYVRLYEYFPDWTLSYWDQKMGDVVIRRGNSNQVAPSKTFVPRAINGKDEVAGYELQPGSTDPTFPRTNAQVWRSSSIVTLPANGFISAKAVGINDTGMVVGSVTREEPNPDPSQGGPAVYTITYPAVWQNDQLVWFGGQSGADPSLRASEAMAVNQAGQVLINTEAKGAGIWSNGQITWVPKPAGDTSNLRTYAQAFNDKGTVVGCLIEPWASAQRQGRSFIYKQGVTKDLTTEVTSKGVKLPAATPLLYCPQAINNADTVVSYYGDASGNVTSRVQLSSVTWVKLTPKP
jgi:hypothetical protein